MVKWGWGWTLYSVITFSIFINLADQNIMKNIFRTVIRVFGFGTLIWYFGTQLTFKIGDLTGSCFDSNETQILEIKSLRSCKSVFGSRWESFDISGHTFLLIWCMYISAYELKQFSLFRQTTHPFMIELAVFLLFGWVTCLNFLWLIMLIATQLFFHNLAEKVLAKILVDLFLLLFLRLNAQLECILPLNKAKDVWLIWMTWYFYWPIKSPAVIFNISCLETSISCVGVTVWYQPTLLEFYYYFYLSTLQFTKNLFNKCSVK